MLLSATNYMKKEFPTITNPNKGTWNPGFVNLANFEANTMAQCLLCYSVSKHETIPNLLNFKVDGQGFFF